jgi:hypothetical protein
LIDQSFDRSEHGKTKRVALDLKASLAGGLLSARYSASRALLIRFGLFAHLQLARENSKPL